MQQSRIDTAIRLLDAVGQRIAANGIYRIGVNRVSTDSGISKMLIYRYFGGLDGLLRAYYNRSRPALLAPSIDVDALKDAPLDEVFDVCCQFIIDEFRGLRQSPEALEFLKADLMRNGSLTSTSADDRDSDSVLSHTVDKPTKLIGTDKGRPFVSIILSECHDPADGDESAKSANHGH